MDLVAQVLSHTFSEDTQIRQQAEHQLKVLESQAGYASTLLQLIVCGASMPLPIKQAAILRLKNNIKQYWDTALREKIALLKQRHETTAAAVAPSQQQQQQRVNPLSAQDRQIIKDNLLEAILQTSSPLIRVHLLECVSIICKADWPDQWPTLLPALLHNLQATDNMARVYGSLCTLYRVFKRWQFSEERAKQINNLSQQCFPSILHIATLIAPVDTHNDSYEMLHIIMKTLFIAVQFHIPVCIRSKETFTPWFQFVLQTLARPVPPALLQSFLTETHTTNAAKHPLWKAKKHAIRLLFNVLQRFGIPSQVQSKKNKPFARYYAHHCISPTLQVVLTLLQQKQQQGNYLSPNVAYFAYNYLSYTLILPDYRKFLQTNVRFLIEECIFPEMCLTANDILCFQHDAQEFIRQNLDYCSEFHDPRVSAQRLLMDLVKLDQHRQSNEVLQVTIHRIRTIAQQHKQSPQDPQLVVLQEGALHIMKALRVVVMKDQSGALAKMMEEWMIQYVFFDGDRTTSPHGFLRARAINVIGSYSRLQWQNQQAQGQSLILVCQGLEAQEELPVRLEAANAISRLVRDERVLTFIKPQLPLIFQTFFTLLDEIGHEEVVGTLQVLMHSLGEEVLPYANSVLPKLIHIVLDLVQSNSTETVAEDDTSALSISEALKAITTVFYALENQEAATSSPIVAQLEPMVHPVITSLLSMGEYGEDQLEDVLELINAIISVGEHVSPFMWQLYPRLLALYYAFANEFLRAITAVVDAYIAYGGEALLANSQLLTMEALQRLLSVGRPTVETLFNQPTVLVSPLDHTVLLCAYVLQGQPTAPASSLSTGWSMVTPAHRDVFKPQHICKVLQTLLSYHPSPRLNHLFGLFIPLLCQRLLHPTKEESNSSHITHLHLALLDVMGAFCLYDPSLFLSVLQQGNVVEKLFNTWLSYTDDEDTMQHSIHHPRIYVLAFSAILRLPHSALPPVLYRNLDQLVTIQIKRLIGLVAEYKRMEEAEAAEEEGEEGGGDDDIFGDVDDDDDDDDLLYTDSLIVERANKADRFEQDEDEDAMEMKQEHKSHSKNNSTKSMSKADAAMASLINEIGRRVEKEDEGEDGEEEGEDKESKEARDQRYMELAMEHEQGEIQEGVYASPLDELDEFKVFETTMQHIQQHEPKWYDKYQKSLKKEKKVGKAYQMVMEAAAEREKKRKEEEEEQAAE